MKNVRDRIGSDIEDTVWESVNVKIATDICVDVSWNIQVNVENIIMSKAWDHTKSDVKKNIETKLKLL